MLCWGCHLIREGNARESRYDLHLFFLVIIRAITKRKMKKWKKINRWLGREWCGKRIAHFDPSSSSLFSLYISNLISSYFSYFLNGEGMFSPILRFVSLSSFSLFLYSFSSFEASNRSVWLYLNDSSTFGRCSLKSKANNIEAMKCY